MMALVVFEWDRRKAEINLKKHAVDFADAVAVFSDDSAITLQDDSNGEERFVSVGLDALGRVLVVAFSWRGERIRLISARRATRRERRQYEERR
jgi:uncharacterized DUF497 family protein